MSSIMSMNMNISSAFKQVSKSEATNSLITTITDNGDLTFGSMGMDAAALLLELDHAMVRPKSRHFVPKKNKAGFYAPDPALFVLPETTISFLDTKMDALTSLTNSLPLTEQAKMWSLMFRYCFYLRNVRGEGKKERLLFYYLFEKLHTVFPKTTEALVALVPDYGYFGDLDVLVKNKSVASAATDCYIKNLNADALQVFGKQLSSITMEEASAFNTKLKLMTTDEIQNFVKGKKLSLAAKHLPREGKKDAAVRQLVIDRAFSEVDRKNPRFMSQRFRYITTALTQCLLVGEQMMTTDGKAGQIQRDWDDILIARAPAGFLNQHRSALLNELKNTVTLQSEIEAGNRSLRPDRIQCRKNMLESMLEGKLKGLQLDLSKLARVINSHITGRDIMEGGHDFKGNRSLSAISFAERSMLATQWKDMMTKLKESIDTGVKEMLKETPDTIDPRNVIPMVDRSGSMESAKVDVEAIALGLMAASISNLPGCMITFSRDPKVLYIDQTKDVFDQFLQVYAAGGGYNTNIDAAYRKLLDIMVEKKVEKSEYALMILTDGHFDSGGLVEIDGVAANTNLFEQVFLGRMEKAFQEKGYNLPRTVFWNLNGRGAYNATATTKGVQMVNGYSQTLMLSVFMGDYKMIVDEQGNKRVDVDPWTSFLKSVTSETFNPVLQVLKTVKEGCFTSL